MLSTDCDRVSVGFSVQICHSYVNMCIDRRSSVSKKKASKITSVGTQA